MTLRGVLVVAGLLIAAAAGGAPRRQEWPNPPGPERFDRVLARVLESRAIVSPACGAAIAPWANRGTRGRRLMLQAYARAAQDRAWNTEFASSLLRVSDWDSVFKFRGASKPCGETHPVPLFTVTWQRGGTEIHALLSFETRWAVLFEADRPLGTVRWKDRADTLFALIRRALPDDSLVQAMSTPAPTAERLDESVHISVPPERLPEAIQKVPPSYPPEARQANVDGVVFVQALVGTDGTIQDAFVAEGSGKLRLLEDAALDAVWQWRFSPAIQNGDPVAVWVGVPVRFTLH